MFRGRFKVVVAGVRQLAPRVREYLLRSAAGQPLPSYEAGAHVAVRIRSKDRGLIVRHYSLVGGAGLEDDPRDVYRIAVQREDRGRGSAHIHATFEAGTELEVGAPLNDFPLGRRDKRVLLIAGGIGITPIFSMARSLTRRKCAFEVFYGGRTRAEMAYHDELAAMAGDRARFHYSDRQGPPKLLELLAAQPAGTVAYVCGPSGMIAAAHAAGKELGWDQGRVRSEMFGASVAPDAQPFVVHLARSGMDVEVGPGVSILDALLERDVPVLWDCGRGECGLCPLPVVDADGDLEHHDRYLSDEERAAGDTMCICVSRTNGRRLVLDA